MGVAQNHNAQFYGHVANGLTPMLLVITIMLQQDQVYLKSSHQTKSNYLIIDSPESSGHHQQQKPIKNINSEINMALHQVQLSRDGGALNTFNVYFLRWIRWRLYMEKDGTSHSGHHMTMLGAMPYSKQVRKDPMY